MKWNKEEGYIKYRTALGLLKSYLGIPGLDIYPREELAPYVTSILEYINKRLIQIGEDSEIKDKLQEIFDIYEYGSDKIISKATIELASELGLNTNDNPEKCDTCGEIIDTDYVPYDQEYFVFTWANLLGTLVLRLKMQYYDLLKEEKDTSCPCSCGKGEDWKIWEKYSSGIYPEDEENLYTGDTQNSWRTSSDELECTQCYRQTTDYKE